MRRYVSKFIACPLPFTKSNFFLVCLHLFFYLLFLLGLMLYSLHCFQSYSCYVFFFFSFSVGLLLLSFSFVLSLHFCGPAPNCSFTIILCFFISLLHSCIYVYKTCFFFFFEVNKTCIFNTQQHICQMIVLCVSEHWIYIYIIIRCLVNS